MVPVHGVLSELLAVIVILSELLAVVNGVFGGVGEGGMAGIVHWVPFGVCGYGGVLSGSLTVVDILSELFAVVIGVFGGVGEGGMAGIAHKVPFGVRGYGASAGAGVCAFCGLAVFASATSASQFSCSGKFLSAQP